MKRLLSLIVILGVALIIGLGVRNYPGVMILSVAGWRVELRLWVGLFLLILLFLSIQLVFKLIAGFSHFIHSIFNWPQKIRLKRSQKFMEQGFIAFSEGRYQEAEKALVKSAKMSALPWLHYVTAAQAAQQCGDEKKCTEYLHQAQIQSPEHPLAIGLCKARLEIEQMHWVAARLTLEALKMQAPQNPEILKLLQKIYEQQEDWAALVLLLPKLKSLPLGSKARWQALEIKAWSRWFQQNETLGTAQDLWQKMPRQLHQSAPIALRYATILQRHKKPVEAEKVVKEALQAHWNESLVAFYGTILHPEPQKLLAMAERWQKQHPESPGLMYTLGQLSEQLDILSNAKRYYEASLTLAPSVKGYVAIAKVLEKMEDLTLSAEYYKKGLLLEQYEME